MAANTHNAQPSFEETYQKAPFAELIRLALALSEAVVKLRERLTESASGRTRPRQHA